MKNKDQRSLTNLFSDQKYHLANIKRQLYQMIADSGKGEESGYEHVAIALEDLTFNHSIEDYKNELLQAVEDMIVLDDVRFDLDHLYTIKNALTSKD